MVVLAVGLTGYGTLAAGEFLSNPVYVETIAASAPATWARKNVEVMISTKVINGKSGPPKVVMAHFWQPDSAAMRSILLRGRYSLRKAVTGSVRVAFITGGSAASRAAVTSVISGVANTARSVPFTP